MTANHFWTHHFDPPTGPVLLSVPHAGRAYDPVILAGLRVPFALTRPLEDRHADRLIALAIAAGIPAIVANTPRLTIDLNRAPDDMDPESMVGATGRGIPASTKARAGLGLVPTRLWGVGPLLRAPLQAEDIVDRVDIVHAPYHAAIAAAMTSARRSFGTALLIDLHSMPPVKGVNPPQIVIGDRFGRTAASAVSAIAEAAFKRMGFRVALNSPYAGGYIVERHANPSAGIHALQIEVDRQLYLDANLDKPGAGLARMQQVVLDLIETLTDNLTGERKVAAE